MMQTFLAAVAGILLALPAAAHDTRYTYDATVVYCYDGDTCTVDIELPFDLLLREQTLRFFCVNTPEVRGVERDQGLAVRDLVRQWLPVGSIFTLQTIQDKTGKYGRYLAVLTPEGWDESVNARLLREGYAEIEAYTDADVARCYDLLGINTED